MPRWQSTFSRPARRNDYAMGTRAQFFIGDPCDIEKREWLGCVAFDGYPAGDLKSLAKCKTEADFRNTLAKISAERYDFTDPVKHDFPFPWKDDLFLTDCTYFFMGDMVMFHFFHSQPLPLDEYLARPADAPNLPDSLPSNVPPPCNIGKSKGTDSIIIISAA